MLEENRNSEINGQTTLSIGGIIAVVLLLLASLGGMIYFFITPVR